MDVSRKARRFYLRGCLALLLLPSALQAQISFNLTSIMRPGDSASVPPELVLVSSPLLNDSAQVAFSGDGAVLLYSNSSTSVVVAYGDPSPGGATFTSIRSPSLNAQGQVAFVGSVTPNDGGGIFLFTGDSIIRFLSPGDPAPGGGTFSYFDNLSLNAAGEVAFTGGTTFAQSGGHLFSPGRNALLSPAGDPAGGGEPFSFSSHPGVD